MRSSIQGFNSTVLPVFAGLLWLAALVAAPVAAASPASPAALATPVDGTEPAAGGPVAGSVRTDDFVTAAKLEAADGASRDALGEVALSADGATLAAAAPNAKIGSHSLQGAVYVFVKLAGGWAGTMQSAKLVASDGAAGDQLGPVTISADGSVVVAGSRAAVGGHGDQGAVYVFVRPAAGWSDGTETAKLTAAGGAANDGLGASVAVSGDGGTVVAGAPGASFLGHAGQGVAYLFQRPSGGWASAAGDIQLIATDGTFDDRLGTAVAVSGDGATVAAGAAGAAVAGHGSQGALYVFIKPAAGWVSSPQAAKLTAADGAAFDGMGAGAAMSGDGTTVAGGAPAAAVLGHAQQGAAYLFLKGSGGWVSGTERAKLTASAGAADDRLAASLALSANGMTLVAGAAGASVVGRAGQGAAFVFDEPGAGWATETEMAELVAADGAAGDAFGNTVGLSADGLTAAAGAPAASVGGVQFRGAAYVLTLVSGGACVPGGGTLCIDDHPGDRRWAVGVTFSSGAAAGTGQAIALASLGVSEGGLFWFFDPTNPEMLLKIIDACTLNQSFWVFYSATTDVGFTVTVRDTRTGRTRTYRNSDGTPAAPVTDTSAFACMDGDVAPRGASEAAGPVLRAPAAPGPATLEPAALEPAALTLPAAAGMDRSAPDLPVPVPPAVTDATACTANAQTLCIGGRFQIRVNYRSATAGAGTAINLDSLGVTQGGLFWFFGATNPEMLIKVLNGCALNQRFWLFYAATTNVGFTLTATDLHTGIAHVYRNAVGTTAPPVLDTAAFACP
jgi:hypothetical protein